MYYYIAFILIGLFIAVIPITMAIFPVAWGIDTRDPSWGAVLPFLMFATVPMGVIAAAALSFCFAILSMGLPNWASAIISVITVFGGLYAFLLWQQVRM